MLAYLDTEFTDFVSQQLISLGVVCVDGAEFYIEIEDYPRFIESQFVKDTVVPLLQRGKFCLPESKAAVEFCIWLAERPEPLVFVIDYGGDYELAMRLLRDFTEPNPGYEFIHHILGPDITAIDVYQDAKTLYFTEHDKRQHHALVDARAMKFALEKACPSLAI